MDEQQIPESERGYTGSVFKRAVEKVLEAILGVQTWTPTITQGVNVTYTAATSRARYVRLGNLVWIHAVLMVSSSGTLNSVVQIGGLPFTPKSATAGPAIGSCALYNGTFYAGSLCVNHSDVTKLAFKRDNVGNYVGAVAPTRLLNTNEISFTGWYERA